MQSGESPDKPEAGIAKLAINISDESFPAWNGVIPANTKLLRNYHGFISKQIVWFPIRFASFRNSKHKFRLQNYAFN